MGLIGPIPPIPPISPISLIPLRSTPLLSKNTTFVFCFTPPMGFLLVVRNVLSLWVLNRKKLKPKEN